MTTIQKIKEELGKISPWPWKTHPTDDYCIVDQKNYVVTVPYIESDKNFIIHSPKRIAALLEYYEAAEGMTSLEGDFDSRAKRLREARAALKKEIP